MPELWPFNWFQNGGRRHLGFLHYVNFDSKYVCGTPFSTSVSNLVQISSKMVALRNLTAFKMAAAAILDFCTMWTLAVNLTVGPHFQPTFQIWCKWVQKWPIELWPKMCFSIWRPPPSWILSDMSSEGKSCPGTLFSVFVSNLVQIRSKMAELLPFDWFQNAGRRHLGFLHCMNFATVNLSSGPHFQPLFQIWCKCVQKWPSYGQKYDFQYGGRRHLGFC